MRLAGAMGILILLAICAGCVISLPSDAGEAHPSQSELSFTELSTDVGLIYTSSERQMGNGNDGVYVADYNNNLREDILAIGNDEEDGPVLFRNTGDGFERTDKLPDVPGSVQGAVWVDYDNDGWEDLLLLRRGDTPIFLENDRGTFIERDVGFDEEFAVPVAATVADATGNGCPDLFIANYGEWAENAPARWVDADTMRDNGNPDAFYRGDCSSFERDDNAGIGPGTTGPHWSMAATFADLTGDGHPDIHVANDYYHDIVYRNNGDGSFTREYLGDFTDRNGMSSTIGDVTGNGQPEIFVTNIKFEEERLSDLNEQEREMVASYFNHRTDRINGNNLLVYRDGDFVDEAPERGVVEGGWGWAVTLADYNSNGHLDVVQGTQDFLRFDRADPLRAEAAVWVQHDGYFYEQTPEEIGIGPSNDRGVVRMDYSINGALDVVMATFDDQYRLYRNDGEQGNSLQVVIGGADHLDHTTLGTDVTATVDGETHHRFHTARADYQSQDTRVIHIGTGEAETVDELEIVWPDGTELTLEDVETGQRVLVMPDGIHDHIDYE